MTQTQAAVAPGWYRCNDTTMRYWDGNGWTEHVAPVQAPASVPVAPVAPGAVQAAPAQQFAPGVQQTAPAAQQMAPVAAASQAVSPVAVAQQPHVAAPAMVGAPTADTAHNPAGFSPTMLAGLPAAQDRTVDIPQDDPAEEEEAKFAAAAYAGIFFLGFIAPLGIYFMKKDESPFIRDHALEVLNHLISVAAAFIGLMMFFVIAAVVGGVVGPLGLLLTIVGWIATLGLFGASAVFTIKGALAAYQGEDFEYPAGFHFLD